MEMNFRLNINDENLIIAVAQDYETNEVLMVAFMNEKALLETLKTKKAHYYSTSRGKQWLKGESSGNIQNVKEIYVDCDADAIIMKVDQIGAACHEGYRSCFFRQLNMNKLENTEKSETADNSYDLFNLKDEDIKIIAERLFDPKEMYK